MITCNRCGKENQDHYKFCLGCGNELAKAVPAPSANAPSAPIATPAPAPPAADPVVEKTPPPLAMARTEYVPASPRADVTPPPIGGAATGGEIGKPAAAAPPAAAKGKGGIPWNDAPKMPAQFTPSPVLQPPVSGSLGAPAGQAPRPAVSNGGSAHPIGNAMPAAAPPSGDVVCSNCGKTIAPGFAFCGSCGTRVPPAAVAAPPAATAAAAAAGSARTMYMAGSQAASPVAAPVQRGRLVLIRPDGSEGGVHPLYDGENVIGRGQGQLFDSDA